MSGGGERHPGRRVDSAAIAVPTATVEARAAEHPLPAGFGEGMAAGRFTADGLRIGFLSPLSAHPSRPSQVDRGLTGGVTAVIADDLHRTRDIAETVQFVGRADAGVVLTSEGDTLPLPGLPEDSLLVPGSPVLTVAAEELAEGGAHATFLAPAPGATGEQLTRVTALDVARPHIDHLSAAVLLGPPGDLHGLRVLDLRVLGLLVEGVPSVPALEQALHVGTEAVHESLGRCLAALRTNDLTAATVRALRGGLRIPPRVTGSP